LLTPDPSKISYFFGHLEPIKNARWFYLSREECWCLTKLHNYKLLTRWRLETAYLASESQVSCMISYALLVGIQCLSVQKRKTNVCYSNFSSNFSPNWRKGPLAAPIFV
jgi:hypothetical protein